MQRLMLLLLCACVGFGLNGCSRGTMSKLGSKDDACYPGKAGVHVVELNSIKLNDKDFTLTDQGDPRPVRVYIVEDDRELPPDGGGSLAGTRGERTLDPPLRWLVNYAPEGQYQIIVEEEGEGGNRWEFPPTARTGFWPVPANDYTLRIGKALFARFTEEVREVEE